VNTYAYVGGQPLKLADPLGTKSFIDRILEQLGFPPTSPKDFGAEFGAETSAKAQGAWAAFKLAAARCQTGRGPPKDDTIAGADCAQNIPAPTLADPFHGTEAQETSVNVYKQLTQDCKASCTLYPELCMKKASRLPSIEVPAICRK